MRTTVVIHGVGLIGGSLGMALRRTGRYRVTGVGRSRAHLRAAVRRGAIDAFTTSIPDAARQADLVVLATPVDRILADLPRWAALARAEAVISDAGSIKDVICRKADQVFRGKASFVGAHPIAGSERTGVGHAQPALFRGAVCVLTPSRASRPEGLARISRMWKDAGARIARLSPAAHDKALAATSHLPHVISSVLSNTLRRLSSRRVFPGNGALTGFAGNGLRDMTRIAASDPALWTGVYLGNRNAISRCLRCFREALSGMERAVERGDRQALLGLLAAASEYRRGTWR